MRLSAIKLAGFKSFVDPAVLRLTSNLSGVVGPNGCGKSNVIDAVRWVLGESSARQLRGEALDDVIFNGARTRKPVGRAAIELVFDNSDGTLGGQYAGFGEISVKREIVRESGSQYYLNGARCRRRDVTDLFLGTGLGGRNSYAIIEQGTISRIIEARPEDMRLLLEEAAGISRYKEKRRETENRIRHTRENLDRLNDLRSELDGQLERLKRQASSAEKYKEYKQQERLLKVQNLGLRYRTMAREAEQQWTALEAAQTHRADTQTALREREAELEAARRDQHRAAEEFQTCQAGYYGAEAEVARIEQALRHARDMVDMRTREVAGLEGQIEDSGRRLTGEQDRYHALNEELRNLEAELAEAAEVDQRAASALDSAEAAAGDEEARIEAFTREAEAPMRRVEVERARVEELERRLRATGDRLARLEAEAGELDTGTLEARLGDLDQAVADLEARQQVAQTALKNTAAALGNERRGRDVLESELHGVREAVQDVRGRVSSLEALQTAALGRDNAELETWLTDQGWAGALRLAERLTVEAGWETAVETVLGVFLQAVCVDRPATRASAIDAWPAGGVALAASNQHDVPSRGELSALAARVQGPVPWGVGPTVYAAEDDAGALAAASQLKAGEAVVSKSGLLVGPDWLHRSGADDPEAGVLAREQALDAARHEAGELATRNEAVVARLDHVDRTIGEHEATLTAHRAELDAAGRQLDKRRAERQAVGARLEQMRVRRDNLHTELAESRRARADEAAGLGEGRSRLAEGERESERLGERRQALQAALQTARAALKAARQAREATRERLQGLRVRQASRRSALEAAEQGARDFAQRAESLKEQVDAARATLVEVQAPVADAERERTDAQGTRAEARAALEAARKRQSETDTTVDELSRRLREAERALDEARELAQSLRLSGETLQVRTQTVAEQVIEAGFQIDTVLEQLPEDATPEVWEEQLAAMDRRIQRLGPINLAAIDEYRDQAQRAEYLADQDRDLRDALDTLENAIRKIDRETRTRFRNTFDQVNGGFRQSFPKLFGGGEAYLELTDDDLLNTGVRVMARPPGKRNSSIQLLSGGEKALTAVALVFSLFELNPAPFCMLDEVDAPLDDANVGRFCELVREMSARVQFVLITHNKGTMELADQLHGVTMQEPGVSRLVTVDVDRALELAAS